MSPWLEAYLTPSSRALKFAAKATLAMLLALYVALWLDLERPYWALISAAFLQIRPLSGMVVEKGLSQLAGTLAGCLAGLAIMAVFGQAPLPALATLTLWIMLCIYGSSLQRSNIAYGCIMAAVTAMLVVVIGAARPDGLFAIAVERLTELGLGAICATLVSALLWPERVGDQIVVQADGVLDAAFRHAAQRLAAGDDADALQASLTGSLEPLTQLEADCQAARFEGPQEGGRIRASHVLTHHTLRLMATLHALQQLLEAHDERLPPSLARLLAEAETCFRDGRAAPDARRRLQALRHRGLALDDETLAPDALRLLIVLREALGHVLVMLDAREAIARPARRRLHGAPLAWHRDHLVAAINALRAGAVFAGLAAFWLATGWANGQVAMLLGTLSCAFFADRDDPVRVSLMFFKGMLAAIPSAFLFGQVLLAQASGFPMLAMLFLPPLFLGLLGSASDPRLAGYCLAFTIGNILLTMPGNGMDFGFDGFVNRALGVIVGLSTVTVSFRLLPGPGLALRRRRLIRATSRELGRLDRRALHEAETRFSGRMADRLLRLARQDDLAPEDQRRLFALGLTALDIGHACLRLRRRLDGLPDVDIRRARREFVEALAEAYTDSARGRPPSTVRARGEALVEALRHQPSLSEHRLALLAGLVERLDLSLCRQAERARASLAPTATSARAEPA